MCGIAGLISPARKYSREHLIPLIRAMAHRGPDGERFWSNEEGSVHLAHRRLAVIDLSDRAAQPMHYLERYTIVHNGEIYNYKELKEELLQKGYRFSSGSDTEVILASFDCWKEDCLIHFDGMFAFAIWDDKDKILFAARDRFGQKPFYYAFDADQKEFCFASEIKAFKTLNLLSEINEKQLLLFLSHGFTNDVRQPASTFYKSIFQLPPAHFLKWKPLAANDAFSIGSWWDLNKERQQSIPEEEAIEKFKALFTASVKKAYRSDVPVGTCLSGGLDSSSIVAIANSLQEASNSYKVFSAVFPGFEKDESKYSGLVAKHFGLQQFIAGSMEEAGDLEFFLRQQDEPVGSASAYAQYKVYELSKQHGIKVLLDGQGADEILGGYTKYIHWFLQELLLSDRRKFKKELSELRSHGLPFDWNWKNYVAAFFPVQAAGWLEKKAFNKIRHNGDLNKDFVEANWNSPLLYKPIITKLNDLLYFNSCQVGLQELLRYADRNSMAHGCEVRLPFLNHHLAEFVFSLPSIYKIRDGYSKWVLRKSVQPVLPAEIVWRKDKIGFEPPQEKWMREEKIQQMIRNAREQLVQKNILTAHVLRKKIQPHDAHAAESFDWRYLAAGYWLQP